MIVGLLAAAFPADAQVAPVWQSRFNTILNKDFDRPNAVAVDASGNVYVTGSNSNGGDNSIVYPINTGFITIKYDASGNQQWLKRYNGPAGGIDAPAAIAVDAAGNVYVTGRSDQDGSGVSYDYATVKYAANGEEVWARRYNGAGNKNDEARALSLDAAGNVFVTGTSITKGKTSDIVTVKYNAAGSQVWETAYAGGKNDDDEAVAIAGDGQGNVYVAGVTALNKPGEDFATIKYDANGNQLWVAGYNGPASASDQVKSIAIDGAGNVVVAGYSTSATGQDFTTLKYDANGNRLWVQRYNGPANGDDQALDVATDVAGNVYLTGFSTGAAGQDFATLKYDANGNQLWVNSYNGPANAADQAKSLALDGAGNVVVAGTSTSTTGQDFATLKYDANGNQLWVNSYNGPANGADQAVGLGTDAAGNVYVAGGSHGGTSNDDFATLKYGADGSQAWLQRYVNTASLSEIASAQTVDAAGNLYVTGYAAGNSTGDDIITTKYDANGTLLWAKMYNGPASAADQAKALAVDGAGNVYVTGYSTSVNGQDYATLKYDASGNLLWVKSYNGPARGADQALALTLDASSNVYVTGNSLGNNSGADMATLKYDANGNLLWGMRYNGLANGFDQGAGVAADALGNVYVTGTSTDVATGGNYTTIKYDAFGTQLWVQHYNGSANGADQASALVLDGAGNLLVTGSSTSATGQDYATLKYDANGNQLWAASYNGLANAADQAKALAVDGAGNVYVTGSSTSATGQDYATLKYDANGVQLWAATYNGEANAADQAKALAVDAAGNVFVAGYSTTATGQDYAWVKYNPLGVQLLAQTYNGPANAADQAIGMDVIAVNATAANLYLAGNSIADAVAAEDLLVAKYKVFTATTWTGVVSKDWNDPANWDNGLPNALIDAIIPAGVPNNPGFATSNTSMKDLIINGGQLSLTGGVFQIAGNVSNTAGTLLATGGSATFTGSVQQTVAATSGGTNTFHSLTVGASGVGLQGPAAVKGVLTLVGNLTTNGHKLLLVSDAAGTAMLVDNSGGVVNGIVTMQRYINPKNPGYGNRHYSSPVANSTVADFATEGFTPKVDPQYNNLPLTKVYTAEMLPNVLEYDETRVSSSYPYFSNGYKSVESLSSPLVPGKGYSINLPPSATVDFVGTLNNGTYSIPLSRGPVSNSGWHLLGNPYPAPIDWDNITLPAGLENGVYVFQSSGQFAGSFAYYVNGTGTLAGGIIPAMQGFFVRAKAPTTFTLTNAARLTTYANPAFNRMQADTRPTVKLQLQAAADGLADQTLIYFDPAAGQEVDAAFDAYKLNLPGVVRPNLYSLAGADKLAVNGLAPLQEEAIVVPLGVATAQSGKHTLRAEEILNFSGQVAVWLEDKQAGNLIDLRKQPVYTFQAGANDADRFYLHFKKVDALTAASEHQLLVYPNPSHKEDVSISMFGLEGSQVKARLTNSLGRVVLEAVLPVEAGAVQGKIATDQLAPGVYYLQLSDGKPLASKKIIVQ